MENKELKKVFEAGGLDLLIQKLKEKGFDQFNSVKKIIELLNISLKEADEAVSNHRLWKKYSEGNNELKNKWFNGG